MSTLHIRPATARDADTLCAFATDTFITTYAAFNTPENMSAYVAASFSPELQAADIADPSGFVLVAEDAVAEHAAAIVAYAQITAREPGVLEVKRFYVAPSWHGRGVARELMDAVARTARARGADTLWLGVWEQNPRAIAFYRKAGFTDAGVTTFMLGDDLQRDLAMVRDLRQSAAL